MDQRVKTITEIPGWYNRLMGDGVPDNNATLYSNVALLYRALRLRCDGLSGIPMKIFRGDGDGAEEVEWPYPTPLQQLVWKWEASALLSGAFYGEIVKNRAKFKKDVIYRNPFDMNVQWLGNGELEIKQNSTGATWINNIYEGTYEMIYYAEYDPAQDLLPGVGAGKAALMDSKLLYSLSKFPEMYFEGGAMPVTLLGIDTTDKGEIKRVEKWFQASATAIKNAFRVLGIRAGSIQPTTLTPPLKDLAFPELTDIARHNIAVAFGIKQTMLDSEAANYATSLEDRKSFYEDTIKPRARTFEEVINPQLLSKEGLRLEFAFDEMDIFQEDEGKRAEVLQKLSLAGIPLLVAMDIAGYKLTDEQLAQLNTKQEEEKQTQSDTMDNERDEDPQREEIRRWQRMVEKRVREGKAIREFQSDIIPASLHGAISGALEYVKTVDDVKRLFTGIIEWQGYP